MKKRLTGYTFDASAKTVVHADFSDITLAGIQMIINVTDQIIIYNFADSAKGGTLSTDTLTLEHDTTSMSDTDELMILVEDGAATLAVSGTVTANLSATDNAVLDNIDADLTTIIGHVDGIEALVGTTNTTLTTIDGRVDGIETLLGTIDADTSNLSVVGGGTEAAAIRVTIANDSTGVISIDDNGGAITVDGTITADLGATDNAVLDAIAASVAAIDTDASTIIGHVDGIEGILTTIDADTGGILTAVQTLDNAISGNEMQVDVVGALPAGTAAIGKLLPPDIDVTAHTNYAKKYYTSTGAATDGIIWSPAAGKRWHITTLYINVSAAATVTLEDDKSGGDEVVWKAELAANSGVIINYPEKYPFASGEDAADLIITTTAGNVYVQAVGYEI